MTVHSHAKRGRRTPEYNSWRAMISRCFREKDPHFPAYGARGITVDPRWRDFKNFLVDMGKRPKGKTLDRINNDGNYTKDNCRWATDKLQHENRRYGYGQNFTYRP